MNEKELEELTAKIEGETLVDPTVELGWVNENLKFAELNEQRSIAAYRMWKFARDDQKMKACEKDLEGTRTVLQYLRERKAKLETT